MGEIGPGVGVIEVLMESPGWTVPTEDLLGRVWDDQANAWTTAVKVIMSRLRTKLGAPPRIETLPKVGYRMRVDR